MPSIDNIPFPGTGLPAGPSFPGVLGTLDGAPPTAPSPLDGVLPAARDATGGFGFSVPGGAGGGLTGILGGFSEFIADLFKEISQWMNGIPTQPGGASPGPSNPAIGPSGDQQFFTSAQASSVGDPHDAFSATTAGGQNVSNKWDSMTSHPYLLDSNSFTGGVRISTQVTQPGANGVTHNESATVQMNDGNTRVTLNADGSNSITSYGKTYSLHAGQSVTLANGQTVSENADGSLSVQMSNGRGGTLAIALRATDGGVDVNAQGANVDLGGYLVERNDTAPVTGAGAPPQASPTLPAAAWAPPLASPLPLAARSNAFANDPLAPDPALEPPAL